MFLKAVLIASVVAAAPPAAHAPATDDGVRQLRLLCPRGPIGPDAICEVRLGDVHDLLSSNEKGWEFAARAAQRLGELEARRPKCADLDVLPPAKKTLVPL